MPRAASPELCSSANPSDVLSPSEGTDPTWPFSTGSAVLTWLWGMGAAATGKSHQGADWTGRRTLHGPQLTCPGDWAQGLRLHGRIPGRGRAPGSGPASPCGLSPGGQKQCLPCTGSREGRARGHRRAHRRDGDKQEPVAPGRTLGSHTMCRAPPGGYAEGCLRSEGPWQRSMQGAGPGPEA